MEHVRLSTATLVTERYDPLALAAGQLRALVSSDVRFRAVVALIRHLAQVTHYSTGDLLSMVGADLGKMRPAYAVFGCLSDAVTVDLHVAYALDREPTGAELDEGRCVFALAGAPGIDAWAAERELEREER